ncbi:unnamed protein product [Choristocarpus tenellus]
MKFFAIVALLLATVGITSGSEYELVQDVTDVKVKASAYDMSPRTEGGCYKKGCKPEFVVDGRIKDLSRWSCSEDIADGEQCVLTLVFDERQEVVKVGIAFYKGKERMRTLKVVANGSKHLGEITSSGMSRDLEWFDIYASKVRTLSFKSLNLDDDEWISITEVGHSML